MCTAVTPPTRLVPPASGRQNAGLGPPEIGARPAARESTAGLGPPEIGARPAARGGTAGLGPLVPKGRGAPVVAKGGWPS